MSMLTDKGADYVTAWPDNIATRAGCSAVYVIRAVNAVTGSNLSDRLAYSDTPIPEIGALTTAQAKAVVAKVFAIVREINAYEKTHCHYCGLPLDAGSGIDMMGARHCGGCS